MLDKNYYKGFSDYILENYLGTYFGGKNDKTKGTKAKYGRWSDGEKGNPNINHNKKEIKTKITDHTDKYRHLYHRHTQSAEAAKAIKDKDKPKKQYDYSNYYETGRSSPPRSGWGN